MIRRAELSDAEEIHQILNSTAELRDYDEGEEYPKYWVKNLIKSDENILLVYEIDGVLAGFLIGQLIKDINEAIENNIYVKPQFRNKKIASKLLKELNAFGKKIRSKFYMGLVLTGNNKMQNLFEKMNYKRGSMLYYYYKETK